MRSQGGETVARPINQDSREATLRNVDDAIAHLRASGRAITRSAIADYIGLSAAYLAKRDSNGNKNYLGQYVDAKLAEANGGCDSPEVLSLRKRVGELEKALRKKDSEIKTLLARCGDFDARNAKLQEQCNALQITINTLYSTHFNSEREEMRKSRIS